MANEVDTGAPAGWKSTHVYTMAVICLLVGVALGYLFRGSASGPAQPSQTAQATPADTAAATHPGVPQQMPSLDQMKHMADKQAEPLLAKLKSDPNNPTLLNQVATMYKATHQFKTAIEYYQKALQADPKNVAARTDMASCLYYEGDIDGALSQLQQSLTYDSKDANSLFNLGMLRWKGKGDVKGATEAWQQLLKSNPSLPKPRRAQVESLIAEAKRQPVTH